MTKLSPAIRESIAALTALAEAATEHGKPQVVVFVKDVVNVCIALLETDDGPRKKKGKK